MKEEKIITIGKGNHIPLSKRNIMPANVELCADARRETCRYWVKIKVNNDDISFEQNFCAFNYRKV